MFEEFIQKLNKHNSKKLPFVAYRKPKEQAVFAVLQNDDSLHYVTDFTESGFVFAPFNTEKKIVLLHCDERLTATPRSLIASQSTNTKTDSVNKDFHINLVKKGIEKIKKSELKKVVLSRKVGVASSAEPIDLFLKLLSNYANAFCYLWYHPQVGTWLGATPEILLKTENQQITTMSLAGTQMYTGEENPFWGKKELEEQQLVTNYISEALKDKVTKLYISERETIKAGRLLHLRSKIIAKYEKNRLLEIVNALHPTPAVCGLPMKASKEFILQNENYDRAYYTGYLGELNLKVETARSSRRKNQENQAYKVIKSATTFFVNLRCMQLRENKAFVYVGGGVTKDSNPEKEWEETVAKTNTMLSILNIE